MTFIFTLNIYLIYNLLSCLDMFQVYNDQAFYKLLAVLIFFLFKTSVVNTVGFSVAKTLSGGFLEDGCFFASKWSLKTRAQMSKVCTVGTLQIQHCKCSNRKCKTLPFQYTQVLLISTVSEHD